MIDQELKNKVVVRWDLINKVAVKRFGEGPLAEEAALAVMDGLQANDWRRVREFSGKSSFTTYILAVTARLIEDFARRKFGRRRPPGWLMKLGGMWRNLYSSLCLERLSRGDAVEIVHQNHIHFSKSQIDKAASEILARIPHCGTHQGLEVEFEEGHFSIDSNQPSGSGQTDSLVEEKERDELLNILFQVVLEIEHPQVSNVFTAKIAKLDLEFQPEERLLLKLCYRENLGVTAAGRLLGLSRFQVHGKMKRLMLRIRTEFERVGLAEDIRMLFDGSAK